MYLIVRRGGENKGSAPPPQKKKKNTGTKKPSNFSELFNDLRSHIFIQNAFENVVCEIAAILSRSQVCYDKAREGKIIFIVTMIMHMGSRVGAPILDNFV